MYAAASDRVTVSVYEIAGVVSSSSGVYSFILENSFQMSVVLYLFLLPVGTNRVHLFLSTLWNAETAICAGMVPT